VPGGLDEVDYASRVQILRNQVDEEVGKEVRVLF